MNEKNKLKRLKDVKEYPEYAFTAEQMKLRGHTKLIDSHENILTYLNDDGTKTIYIFSAPIENEKLVIRQEGYGYLSNGNYVDVKMPGVLSRESGINVGGFIDIFPMDGKEYNADFEEKANVFGQKKGCVVYRDFYIDGVSLNCYTTSFGLNTEIVIPEYTGKNNFIFRIKQPAEFFPMEDSPDYVVFRDETEKSMLYTSLAVDADGKWNYKNQLKLLTDSDGSYLVCFVIDDEFLQNPGTKYPVTINQSLNIYKHKQPDTSVYSGAGDMARHYLSPFMLLGDKTVKGEGWALIRYEFLDNIDIPADKIISADYNFANLFDSMDEVTVGAYAIINDWCSINTRWGSRPGYDTLRVNSVKIKDRGSYSIDITKLLVEIIKGKGQYEPPYSVRNSFFIKSDTPDSNVMIAAGDSGIFSPYLRIVVEAEEN